MGEAKESEKKGERNDGTTTVMTNQISCKLAKKRRRKKRLIRQKLFASHYISPRSFYSPRHPVCVSSSTPKPPFLRTCAETSNSGLTFASLNCREIYICIRWDLSIDIKVYRGLQSRFPFGLVVKRTTVANYFECRPKIAHGNNYCGTSGRRKSRLYLAFF